ncbi:hypothetical protein [Planococcus sp. CAU13]|uniref:hypothetical protein n=1 Tax=Planococcus sp. CAU13 TaxID=1541197 RepID=UPI00052FFE20|nr:hypothetical protein [Planococcus sp. CAU13]
MEILLSVIFGFSILISIGALFYVMIAHNWKSFLVLGVGMLPISLYFLSGEPPVQYFGFFSLICFIVAISLYIKNMKSSAFQ